MINNNIFNIFCFLTFSFGYFLDLVFRAIFFKFGQNTGFVKYPKPKNLKTKKENPGDRCVWSADASDK